MEGQRGREAAVEGERFAGRQCGRDERIDAVVEPDDAKEDGEFGVVCFDFSLEAVKERRDAPCRVSLRLRDT